LRRGLKAIGGGLARGAGSASSSWRWFQKYSRESAATPAKYGLVS